MVFDSLDVASTAICHASGAVSESNMDWTLNTLPTLVKWGSVHAMTNRAIQDHARTCIGRP